MAIIIKNNHFHSKITQNNNKISLMNCINRVCVYCISANKYTIIYRYISQEEMGKLQRSGVGNLLIIMLIAWVFLRDFYLPLARCVYW